MRQVQDITFEAGSFVVTDEGSRRTRYPIADMLRAADIPVLTIIQLELLTTMADMFSILLETLIENGVIPKDFARGYDYSGVSSVMVSDLGSQILR